MTFRNIMMAACTAAFAMALVVPPSAGATEIIHRESGHFTGAAEFQTLGTGVRCKGGVTARLHDIDGTTLTATLGFSEPEVNCEGFGFTFGNCDVEKVETTSPDFLVHTAGHTLNVTNVVVWTKLVTDGICPHHAVEVTFANMAIGPTPGEDADTFTEHIHSATVTGVGQAHVWSHQAVGTDPTATTLSVNGHAGLEITESETDTWRLG